MPKTTSINLRISPEFRQELEALAEYHGLSMSSYAHSLLVKAVRKERLEIDLPIKRELSADRKIDGQKLARKSRAMNIEDRLNKVGDTKRKTG